MKYLKYFESNLWKYINSGDAGDFISNHKQVPILERDFDKIRNILPTFINSKNDITKIVISITYPTKNTFWIYFFDDDYFLLIRKSNSDSYFLIDGWDGLQEVLSKLVNEIREKKYLSESKQFESVKDDTIMCNGKSLSIIDIRMKLKSIIDMLNYLWSNNMGDTLNNFTGSCSILFMGAVSVRSGWSRDDTIPPYDFDIESFLNEIKNKKYIREYKLQKIEDLYKLSKSERFKNSKSEIIEKLKPILNYEIFGGKMIESFKIEQHYKCEWVDQIYKPCFSIHLNLCDDLFEVDRDFIPVGLLKNVVLDQEILKTLKSDFYKYRTIIEDELQKINISGYKSSISDYTHNKSFFTLRLLLESN